jgi:transposase
MTQTGSGRLPASTTCGLTLLPRRHREEAIFFNPCLYRARNGAERFFKKIKLCRRVVQPDQCEGYDH